MDDLNRLIGNQAAPPLSSSSAPVPSSAATTAMQAQASGRGDGDNNVRTSRKQRQSGRGGRGRHRKSNRSEEKEEEEKGDGGAETGGNSNLEGQREKYQPANSSGGSARGGTRRRGGGRQSENYASKAHHSDTEDKKQQRQKKGGRGKMPLSTTSNDGGTESKPGRKESRDFAAADDPPKSSRSGRSSRRKKNELVPYPSYWSLDDCMALYAAKDPTIVRGKIRILPAKNAKAFVSCDRGFYGKDVLIETSLEQNRALDGDIVFVELYPEEQSAGGMEDLTRKMDRLPMANESDNQSEEQYPTWQDDPIQKELWNPTIAVRKKPDGRVERTHEEDQRKGRVVLVVPPKETAGTQPSELNPTDKKYRQLAPRRTIVGSLKRMPRDKGDLFLLTPNNKSLPQFLCPSRFKPSDDEGDSGALYKAEYEYGTWQESHRWPSCINVVRMGSSCNVEDETLALLIENDVNHGDFPSSVLRDVDLAVESGIATQASTETSQDLGWRPTPEMYHGRRDYRKERIFTIDPTTAKDLDDALHIKKLPDGGIEIGVHIADVSHFVKPETAVDKEAQRRATTVYLVDRTVPMLPRPLCEVACSLNENVERLAFSCVWRMNIDGTMTSRNGSKGDDVWYGRTVIKSCARLDYATAQNIIENKVATGEAPEDMDKSLWPASRRPTGGHTISEVAADVRLMHVVAMARRKLRFRNGAIALNGIKLAFQLESDGETPKLCAPYPIRDSNRLVEEYMLLANYLVAQRLISHAGGLALLRHHPPPLMLGIESVVKVAKEGMGFDIDATSSQTLQESLSRLGRECDDDLVLQCVTEMLTAPMQPAEYVAAGEIGEEEWRHFALNIPYYTHFTSPIRRYADVIVHRLLQATIDGAESVEEFPMEQRDIQNVATHCNEKRMGAKKAQERSDRVFLALYLRQHPLQSELGVCLSVGEKTFTVFVPSLGASLTLYLDEHKDDMTFKAFTVQDERRILLTRKAQPGTSGSNTEGHWGEIEIKVFTKVRVSCSCKDTAPIDVKVRLVGPWT